MILSPLSVPFFSCPSSSHLNKRDLFLCKAQASLSRFDFVMFKSILSEWESSPLLSLCFDIWEKSVEVVSSLSSSLYILTFNVRGLEERWHEVVLLISSLNPDIIILLETGVIDLFFYKQLFSNLNLFFQPGENSYGGVLMLVKNDIHVVRIECSVPNVCVLDVKLENTLRIVGMYAPESRSWSWSDISYFISDRCTIFGDFNVDLEQDKK